MLLLLVFLTYVSDKQLKIAGGTVHFLECAKRWARNDNLRIVTLTTPLGASLLAKHGFRSQFILRKAVCEGKTDTLSTIVSWISRCSPIIRLASEESDNQRVAIVTESSLLPDIVAGMSLRRQFPRATLFCYLHHLIPAPSVRLKYHPMLQSIFAWIGQELSLFLLKRSRFKILTYASNRRVLSERGISSNEIVPIASGVDLGEAAKEDGGETTFDACFLGRLSPLKGVIDLVRIWRIVVEKLPGANLVIVGAGDEGYTRQVRDRIKRENMEKNIDLLGWVDGPEKFKVLKASRLLVSASKEEGWGISICEAMACGLPVVAYDIEAYRWAFPKGILLAPVGDVRTFATHVTSLLTNETFRLSMGREATRQSLQYDWNEIAASELSRICPS
jgi:glycosyltransferase involved in cell wall biosynthesis